jgi:hypothetical protein
VQEFKEEAGQQLMLALQFVAVIDAATGGYSNVAHGLFGKEYVDELAKGLPPATDLGKLFEKVGEVDDEGKPLFGDTLNQTVRNRNNNTLVVSHSADQVNVQRVSYYLVEEFGGGSGIALERRYKRACLKDGFSWATLLKAIAAAMRYALASDVAPACGWLELQPRPAASAGPAATDDDDGGDGDDDDDDGRGGGGGGGPSGECTGGARSVLFVCARLMRSPLCVRPLPPAAACLINPSPNTHTNKQQTKCSAYQEARAWRRRRRWPEW